MTTKATRIRKIYAEHQDLTTRQIVDEMNDGTGVSYIMKKDEAS